MRATTLWCRACRGMGLPSAVANAVSEMVETGNLAYSLLPMLTRSLFYANREDLIPEFKRYAASLESWGSGTARPCQRTSSTTWIT